MARSDITLLCSLALVAMCSGCAKYIGECKQSTYTDENIGDTQTKYYETPTMTSDDFGSLLELHTKHYSTSGAGAGRDVLIILKNGGGYDVRKEYTYADAKKYHNIGDVDMKEYISEGSSFGWFGLQPNSRYLTDMWEQDWKVKHEDSMKYTETMWFHETDAGKGVAGIIARPLQNWTAYGMLPPYRDTYEPEFAAHQVYITYSNVESLGGPQFNINIRRADGSYNPETYERTADSGRSLDDQGRPMHDGKPIPISKAQFCTDYTHMVNATALQADWWNGPRGGVRVYAKCQDGVLVKAAMSGDKHAVLLVEINSSRNINGQACSFD